MRNFLPDLRDLIDDGDIDGAIALHKQETGASELRAREFVQSIVRTGYPPRPGHSADQMVDEFRRATALMARGEDEEALELYQRLAEVDAATARDELVDRLGQQGAPRMTDEALHRHLVELQNHRQSLRALALYRTQRDCDVREAKRVLDSLVLTGYPPLDGYSATQMGDGFVQARVAFIGGDEEAAIEQYCHLSGEDHDTARARLERARQDQAFRDAPAKFW